MMPKRGRSSPTGSTRSTWSKGSLPHNPRISRVHDIRLTFNLNERSRPPGAFRGRMDVAADPFSWPRVLIPSRPTQGARYAVKLARNVVAPAVLGLCLGLAGGCGPKKPPGTTPPGETGGEAGDGGETAATDASNGGSEGTDTPDTTAGDTGGTETPPPADCAAKVADTPTLLFNDKVIFRPPPGVEFVLDGNPTFAQASMSGGFISTCDASIKRVMISVFEAQKKRKPAAVANEMIEALASQGYADGKKSAVFVDTANDYHLSVEYAGAGGSQATVLYIAVARRGDTDFVIIYESGPEDYKLLKPTYEESAKSLFIVPDA